MPSYHMKVVTLEGTVVQTLQVLLIGTREQTAVESAGTARLEGCVVHDKASNVFPLLFVSKFL